MAHHKVKKIRNIRKDHAAIFILISFLCLIMIGTVINNALERQQLTLQSNAQQTGFHLTEELYGTNTNDALSMNVHVKFNFDGCDGDIGLYKDGQLIAGINAWNSFGGTTPFDYNEKWTASPYIIYNDGQPHAISFRGEVRRCPKSTVVLWDDVTCTVTFDSSGLPQIAPSDKCTIKNLSEIQPVPITQPHVIPTAPLLITPITASSIKVTPTNSPGITPGEPTPTATPTIIPNTPTPTPTVIIQFMGIKLGSLSNAQSLNIFWDFIRKIIGL